MARPVSKARRQELGHMLLAVAVMHEGQVLALTRLQGMYMSQLTDKERKALRTATMLVDRSNRFLRVLGNRLEEGS